MMKTGVAALGALSLINVAAAKPSGHHRRHQQLHEKRQEVDIVYETDYSYVTTQLPDVVVFVDENGAPYSTSTEGQVAATSAAASVAATSTAVATQAAYTAAASSSSTSSVYVAPSSATTLASVYLAASVNVAASSSEAATTTQATSQAAATTSKTSSAASSSSTASGSGPSGYGLVYSPYTSSGGCKSQSEVNSDFASISSFASSNGDTWSFVRTYGTDCNQVATVLSAAKDYDLKLFAGVYDISTDDSMNDELALLIKAASGNWDYFQTIAIGNEVVNDGTLTADEVADRVSSARTTLASAGYTGNVVAVDTLVAVVANPTLCDVSDYVAVNSHPFFDGSVAAADSGPWLLEQMERVSEICGGKDTWITETGWPTQGDTNGDAIPSTANQKAAISSIKSSISSNIIWFTAFNDLWKTASAATYNAEQYWGICN